LGNKRKFEKKELGEKERKKVTYQERKVKDEPTRLQDQKGQH